MNQVDKLLIFALSDLQCALPLAVVERILRTVAISPVPRAPEIVMGLVNVQGQVMPVLNMRKLFRLPEIEMTLNDQLIIARTASRPVAILVDSVVRVADYSALDIIAPEELFPGIEYLEGVAKLPDGIIYIYNLDRFFASEDTLGREPLLSPDILQPESGE